MAGCRKLAVFGSKSPAEEEGAEDAISPGETPHCFQTEEKKPTLHGQYVEIRTKQSEGTNNSCLYQKRLANISYKVYRLLY